MFSGVRGLPILCAQLVLAVCAFVLEAAALRRRKAPSTRPVLLPVHTLAVLRNEGQLRSSEPHSFELTLEQ